jgi:NCS1 family nucleobase:cation symporter-1
VEEHGVEPVPPEERTVGWRDLFAILFAFNLSPLIYVLGALAVTAGDLPLWWSAAAIGLGTLAANVLLAFVARPGVDLGLPGQVAMRATFGRLGSRALTSPYRVVASGYWFAAQALAGALGVKALVGALTDSELPLVPVALGVAAVSALLAVAGFDALRYFVRVVLPLSLVLVGIVVALYLTAGDAAFSLSRVSASPAQAFTWLGFASFFAAMLGAQLTIVTNIADFFRYARSRKDMQVGLLVGSPVGAFAGAWVGAYAAVAIGESNPFEAAADLTDLWPILLVLVAAILAQTISVNVLNVYTGGLSLVNTAPRLGRFVATALVAAGAVALAGFPGFIEDAEKWFLHLGNVAAPITGAVLADYLVVKRQQLDLDALYAPDGPYHYIHGLNLAAVGAVAVGIGVYYATPDEWLKPIWGLAVAAAVYLVVVRIQATLSPGRRLIGGSARG